ncbi:MAG: methyltransferase domain-containing protein [Clostridiales bacterium]|nr:methyltransferase domain-containing protein [Clostridiales bacterium]
MSAEVKNYLIPDIKSALAEFYRVLKPTGILFF